MNEQNYNMILGLVAMIFIASVGFMVWIIWSLRRDARKRPAFPAQPVAEAQSERLQYPWCEDCSCYHHPDHFKCPKNREEGDEITTVPEYTRKQQQAQLESQAREEAQAEEGRPGDTIRQ